MAATRLPSPSIAASTVRSRPMQSPMWRSRPCPSRARLKRGYMRGSPQREFAFFTESFIDELAHAAGHGAARVSHVDARRQRAARALSPGRGAARAMGWRRAGSTMGIAGCSAFGSHIGLVASASIGDDQQIKVHRAGRRGRLRPRRQYEHRRAADRSRLIWALAQATSPTPEWVAGMPRARPFGGLGLPRLGDAPEIIVELIPSSERAGRSQRARRHGRSRPPSPTRSTPAPASGCARCRSILCRGMSRPPTTGSPAEDRRAAGQPRHARRARGARGAALSRRIPERPASDRNPGDRVEADPARDHPEHAAAEIRPRLSPDLDRRRLAARARSRSARPSAARAAAGRAASTMRCATAIPALPPRSSA